MDIRKRAEELSSEIIEIRRDLHRHPEVSGKEFRTTQKVCDRLTELGIPFRKLEPTGVIADIKGGKPGRCIALRADMDALEITEKTGLSYASENGGVMHACGHDCHVAMLLGTARILNEIRDELTGSVRLIFQPAEEIGAGARWVVEQKGLEGVDAILGQHVGNVLPAGTFGTALKESHAAGDEFTITVRGLSGHGAKPEACRDATVAAAAIVLALQTMVSREFAPDEPVVVTVGQLHSGTRFNIISGEAVLNGTTRCYSKEVHEKLPVIMERIAKHTAESYGCTAELKTVNTTEVLINSAAMVDLCRETVTQLFGEEHYTVIPPTMGGEDFATYVNHVPGAFVRTGSGSSDPGGELSNHCDRVLYSEAVLWKGTALFAQAAVNWLRKESNE